MATFELETGDARELRTRGLTPYAPGALSHQEGVLGAGDLKVTPGSGLSVNVTGGSAVVTGDDIVDQGTYIAKPLSGGASVPLSDSSGSTPRIDQIILRVYDVGVIGGNTDGAVVQRLEGSPILGATLDNRSGAATLPRTAVRLADVLVKPGATSLASGDIRDRRPWARGFQYRLPGIGGDLGVPFPEGVGLFGARLEVSPGNDVLIGLSAQCAISGSNTIQFSPTIDGGIPAGQPVVESFTNTGAFEGGVSPTAVLSPSAGSRVFGWFAYAAAAAGATIRRNDTQNLVFWAREIVGGSVLNA